MSEKILDYLKEMRLPAMAEGYLAQKNDPSVQNLSFDERFEQLVTLEYDSRYNHTIEKNIKNAHFPDQTASLDNINYKPDRNLDARLIEELRTNEYIRSGLNIIITGASGCGKTWIACALGTNACMEKLKVLHITLNEFLNDCEAMKTQGNYKKYMRRINKFDLLIIDDFLLSTPQSEAERMDFLNLIDSRNVKKSIIICSQWLPEGWHDKLGGGPIADATLDRIMNSSYNIDLQGKSLREEYSKLKK